jgi:hypothetical protein
MFDLLNFAYLDPSTGSLVIQSLIGVIAGVSVFGRNAVSRVAEKTKRLFSSKQSTPATTSSKSEAE